MYQHSRIDKRGTHYLYVKEIIPGNRKVITPCRMRTLPPSALKTTRKSAEEPRTEGKHGNRVIKGRKEKYEEIKW